MIVYASSPKSKYFTFCTPEYAKSIDEYLEARKRYGETSLKRDHHGNWTSRGIETGILIEVKSVPLPMSWLVELLTFC